MDNNSPKIIANTYKIGEQIGAGGGGTVYLAEHMRLDKLVVVKEDVRTLAAKPEVLRREVDALKNLSHSNIPQVYDFIIEDGKVYTVMEFIDGESLDKPLKRGQRFTQVQVIEWAIQLLDALAYLHSRPPHGILHADIKPANIMLTTQNDVKLIDFNIALALGEDGAIAVGRSFGYASPEHYNVDYNTKNVTSTSKILTDVTVVSDMQTVLDDKTVLETKQERLYTNSTSAAKTIMLDVRSDIYSLGATLYHIISGNKPNKNAEDVEKIVDENYSPAVIAIIEKSMNPNPDLRYQTADEMSRAFKNLRKNDSRVKKFKLQTKIMATFSILTISIGSAITFVGMKQLENLQNAYVLAEYSSNELQNGDVDKAIEYALMALPVDKDIFTPPYTANAQKALTDALNVYDLSNGFKDYKVIELPSAPLYTAMSPEGNTFVCMYAFNISIFDTNTAELIVTLPCEESALSEVEYINENTVAYASPTGVKIYDIKNGVEIFDGELATAIAISENGKMLATVYKDETFANIYDIENMTFIRKIDFNSKYQRVTVNDTFVNPEDNILEFNDSGDLLAVSFEDGSLNIFDVDDIDNDIEIFDEESEYKHFDGGFYKEFFAFSALYTDDSVFAIIDTKELYQTGGFSSSSEFNVKTNKDGIYIATDNIVVKIDPVTGDQEPLVTTNEDILNFSTDGKNTIIATEKGFMFFDEDAKLIDGYENTYSSPFVQIKNDVAIVCGMDSPFVQILKYEDNYKYESFEYDTSYIHDEARISHDYKTFMLFSYNKFRIYNAEGVVICDVDIPNAEQVYDQQFKRTDTTSYLEVTYNDGSVVSYSAEDGGVLEKSNVEKPDLTLFEEFYTNDFRIESPLHGAPVVYDKDSGKLVTELEKDSYLTYVTQVDDYIITEYVSTSGERYGMLLNEKCETLGYLPNLCDIIDGQLIFDYETGNLRKSKIYSVDELIEMGRNKIMEDL